jgi:HAD superfamily hydrolase (TIGR01509 family)
MAISAYIFDLDGTLIDSEGIWARCIFKALVAAGAQVTFPEICLLDFGKSWEELFQGIQARWPGCYRNRHEMEHWMAPTFQELSDGRDLCIPGSKELLLRLARAKYPLTIVSGSTRLQIQQAIRRLGVEEHIRCFVSCEDVQAGKPDPEGFLKGAELLRAKPENCLVFEDKHTGVVAAKAAGMRCVLLQRPQAIPQKTSLADLVLTDLADFNPKDLE